MAEYNRVMGVICKGRNYALQSKDSHYLKKNTKLEFTESQFNSP